MKRDELVKLVKKHTKDEVIDKEGLREELIAYLRSEKGQKAIQKAPRVILEITPDLIQESVPDQPVEVIADMILREWS